MKTITSIAEMQRWTLAEKRAGCRVGFVPTMGYLHEGHLSLMRGARHENDRVVVSIFVNPLQFGPNEDFATYPRDIEGDARKVESARCAVLFLPQVDEMYPEGFQTHIDVEALSKGLCGAHRPGHFRGVATVVAKLFQIVPADAAYFGEKDFQQLQVIRRMVKDLHFQIRIVGMPTLRDEDGLAMSSRNVRLSREARQSALVLPRALADLQEKCRQEVYGSAMLLEDFKNRLSQDQNIAVEYAEIVHPEMLSAVERAGGPHAAVLAAAIRVGGVRLIDHALLGVNGGE